MNVATNDNKAVMVKGSVVRTILGGVKMLPRNKVILKRNLGNGKWLECSIEPNVLFAKSYSVRSDYIITQLAEWTEPI